VTIILGAAALLTAILSGVIGMGGGITLLAVMTFFMSTGALIPIHGIVQLFSNSSRAYFLKDKILWKYFIPFTCGTPFGAIIAFKLLQTVTHKNLFLIPLITIILYVLFKPKKLPPIKIERRGFFVLGLFTAFAAPLIGATGPLMAAFFLRDDLDKEEIVATKASVQVLTHLLKNHSCHVTRCGLRNKNRDLFTRKDLC